MHFGIHSLLFNETFIEKNLPVLDRCAHMGFDAVEIIPFDPDNFPARKVRQAAADLGLTIKTGYGMPGDYNTISPDPTVRASGITFSKRLIDLSNEAGAVVFGGAVRFIRDVGAPNVKVHLDTFHMVREEDDIPRAVHRTGSDLGYVHACENHRGIPGRGLVPWIEFFAALRDVGYDGCVTIESFDPSMERIAKLICFWRQLADSPEQLATEGLAFLKGVHHQVYGSAPMEPSEES